MIGPPMLPPNWFCLSSGCAAETRRRRDDARNQRPELREVAAVERQIDDLLVIDRDAECRVRGLDEWRLARDGDALFEAADGELQIDARRVADGDGVPL